MPTGDEAGQTIESRRRRYPLFGFCFGLLATYFTALPALISGGAGHGDYGFARLFYPFTMLLSQVTGNSITTPLLILALAQFPLYGVVIGMCGKSFKAVFVAVLIFLAHAVAVAFCFSGVIPSF